MPRKIFAPFLISLFLCLGWSSEAFAESSTKVSATNQAIYDIYLNTSDPISTC